MVPGRYEIVKKDKTIVKSTRDENCVKDGWDVVRPLKKMGDCHVSAIGKMSGC